MNRSPDTFVSAGEAAKLLGIPESLIRGRLAKGEILPDAYVQSSKGARPVFSVARLASMRGELPTVARLRSPVSLS